MTVPEVNIQEDLNRFTTAKNRTTSEARVPLAGLHKATGKATEKRKKAVRRRCRLAQCPNCQAASCGECNNCRHPEYRNRCINREGGDVMVENNLTVRS